MTWVTWRQHRTEFFAAILVLLLMIPVVFVTRQSLIKAYTLGSLDDLRFQFSFNFRTLILFFQLLPMMLGMFVGAPLISTELEHKTHYLAWTQGITRRRWLAIKLAWVGGATVAIFGLLAGLLMLWSQPVVLGLGPWGDTFEVAGPVIIGYALFALALGALLGAMLSRLLPAMALTMLIFYLVRLGVATLRRVFLPPLHVVWNFAVPDPNVKDWIIQMFLINRYGMPSRPPDAALCGPFFFAPGSKLGEISVDCYRSLGYQISRLVQPAERFWTFQAIETAIFLALTAIVVALTFWWVSRRIH